jgi:protoporphyrinogen/coproporphyrinogen III oxidase
MSKKVLIIGGGISGLSAAYYLNKAGVRATVIERAPELGGVIRTSTQQGCVIEGGPDSFMAAKPWCMELIREVGLADQVIGSNDHLRITYILKNGRLIPLPDGLMMMVPTKIMPLIGTHLLSWGAKIRMGLELLRRAPKEALPDRTVHDFLLDHYGQESIDYLAEPLLAGVYGGDPREMSVRSVLARFVEIETKYGSLTRGVLAAPKPKGSGTGGSLFRSLKYGMGSLVDALRPSADVLQGEVEALERNGTAFRAKVNGNWIDADEVVVATPAGDAARLLEPWNGNVANLLNAVPYTSSVTMALGYRKDTFDHPLKGFGFLVPKKERKLLAACTWVGNKFNNRVPDDMVMLRCFMGGAALKETDEALVENAVSELRRIMGLEARPVFHNIARWPNSMAQYTVGHEKRVQELETILKKVPGLHLAGNAYRGIGLPDCVRMGKEAAARIVMGSRGEHRPS